MRMTKSESRAFVSRMTDGPARGEIFEIDRCAGSALPGLHRLDAPARVSRGCYAVCEDSCDGVRFLATCKTCFFSWKEGRFGPVWNVLLAKREKVLGNNCLNLRKISSAHDLL